MQHPALSPPIASPPPQFPTPGLTLNAIDADHAVQFIQHAATGVWQLGPEGIVLYANERMAQSLGCTVPQLVGRNVFDFVHPDDRAMAEAAWHRRMNGQPEHFEWRLRRVDQTCAWGRVSSVPLRNAAGEIVGALAMFTDITAQKNAEHELAGREAFQRRQSQLLELAHDVILVRDLQDRIAFWNTSAARTYGYPREVALGCVSHTLLRTTFPQPLEEIMRELLTAGQWKGELTHRCRDGSELIMDSRWALQTDEAGVATAILEINRDITAQKRLETELRRRESTLNAALEVSSAGTYRWNLLTGAAEWDRSLAQVFGLPEGQSVESYEQFLQLVHPDDRQRVISTCDLCRRERRDLSLHYRVIRPDGTVRWIHARGKTPQDGEPDGNVMIGACIDVTEQARVEADLRANEARLRSVFETAAVGIAILDASGRWIEANDTACRITGYSRDALLARTFRDVTHPDDLAAGAQQLRRLVAGEIEQYSLDQRYVRKDGRPVWVSTTLSRMLGHSALDPQFLCVIADISERKEAETRMREGNERLMAALAASQTGTFVWDIRTNHLSWDEDLNRLFGLSGGHTVAALPEFLALVHPEDRPRVVQACQRCASEGANFHEEFRVTLADGSIRWLEDKGRTFFSADGHVAYMTGACVDITHRKRAEEAMVLARHRFELVREASGVGFWFCDLPFDRLDWDARVKEHFGLPPDANVTLDTFFERMHPEDRERVRQAIERSIATLTRYDIEYRTIGLDGSQRWIRAMGGAHVKPDGTPFRFDGVTIDITANVQARRLLQERQEELERIVAERTASLRETVAELEKFSYSISHDLRAPLRAMQSFALILQEECEDRLPAEGRDYLRRIVVAASRMDRLIQDVLSYSRLARAEMPLRAVDLQRLVHGIIETYPQFHDSRGAITIINPLPAVLANEAALTQCLSNLLTNALKFRRPDTPADIRVWCDTSAGRVRLCVRDNGIGIEAKHLDRIFELFEQVNHGYEGTGIGLAIVRKAADRMGALLGVQSQPGAGSTFWLEFPRAPSP